MTDRLKRIIAAFMLAFTLFTFGCAKKPQDTMQEQSVQQSALLQPTQSPKIYYTPMIIIKQIDEYERGYIVYPKISGAGKSELINDSMHDEIYNAAMAQSVETFSEYTIKNNSNGIYSVVISIYGLHSGDQLSKLSLTYDCESGKKLSIGDCLDSENDNWRWVIPELVKVMAQSRDITLLNEILPIDDDQSYYISAGSIVIQYGLYEIATYSAGTPEFSIPVSQLKEFFTSDSPLERLL